MREEDSRLEAGCYDDLWKRATKLLAQHVAPNHVATPPRSEEDLDRLCVDLLDGFRRAEDRRLFQLLTEVCEPYLRRVGSRLVRPRPFLSIDDLICDTFASVFSHLDQFRPRGRNSFFRWLNIIAKNHAKMADRARKRRLTHEKKAAVPEGIYASDPLSELLRQEDAHMERSLRQRLAKEIQNLVERLPDKTRRCWLLRWEQGLSNEQIARALNLTVGAVTMRLKRTRESVQRAIMSKGLQLPQSLQTRQRRDSQSVKEASR